jgi:hypothetical protein
VQFRSWQAATSARNWASVPSNSTRLASKCAHCMLIT